MNLVKLATGQEAIFETTQSFDKGLASYPDLDLSVRSYYLAERTNPIFNNLMMSSEDLKCIDVTSFLGSNHAFVYNLDLVRPPKDLNTQSGRSVKYIASEVNHTSRSNTELFDYFQKNNRSLGWLESHFKIPEDTILEIRVTKNRKNRLNSFTRNTLSIFILCTEKAPLQQLLLSVGDASLSLFKGRGHIITSENCPASLKASMSVVTYAKFHKYFENDHIAKIACGTENINIVVLDGPKNREQVEVTKEETFNINGEELKVTKTRRVKQLNRKGKELE